MKIRLFKDISVGCEFFANGNLWVKKSSRTATPSAYPTRVFYFKGGETVADKGVAKCKQ